MTQVTDDGSAPWLATACTICSQNCGLEVQIADGHIVRTRGDKGHPVSNDWRGMGARSHVRLPGSQRL